MTVTKNIMKTSELTGAALDWAVAKCCPSKYGDVTFDPKTKHVYKTEGLRQIGVEWRPSSAWSDAGPIIEMECISTKYLIITDDQFMWVAKQKMTLKNVKPEGVYGPTLLIAAMRCHVASKFGDEIEIPEELK